MDLSQITVAQVAAFLGGSLGTLIINSILEYFSKKSEHRRQLEKLTYEKKLKIAESAIAFYSHYKYNVIQMKSGLASILRVVNLLKNGEDFPDFNFEIVQENMLNIGAMIKDMFGPKYQEILSMNLYFDFSQNIHFKTENLIKFNNALAQCKAIDQDMEFWNNLADSELEKGNDVLSKTYSDKSIELMDSYGKSLEIVIDLLDVDSLGSEEIVETIKSQIKIY